MKTRTIKHTILLTPEENKKIQEESDKYGMKPSAYIRDKALNGRERNNNRNKIMCTTLVTISKEIDLVYDLTCQSSKDYVEKEKLIPIIDNMRKGCEVLWDL